MGFVRYDSLTKTQEHSDYKELAAVKREQEFRIKRLDDFIRVARHLYIERVRNILLSLEMYQITKP